MRLAFTVVLVSLVSLAASSCGTSPAPTAVVKPTLPPTPTPPATPASTLPVSRVIITRTPGSSVVAVVADTLPMGYTIQLYATQLDEYGALTTPRPVQWGSTSGAATVSQTGLLTIGYGPNSSTITAHSENGTGILSVRAPFVPGLITLSMLLQPTARVGDILGAGVSAIGPSDLADQYNDFVWSTSDPSVAVVNSMNGSNTATFRAVGKGTVTITVIPTMERTIKATGVLTVQ